MRLLILRTVLVATDLDPSSRDALDSAYRLAALAGAALHVVHVVSSTPGADEGPASIDEAGREVRTMLRRANIPDRHVRLHVIPGSAAQGIGSLADRLSADVIVIGRHRHEARAAGARALGSTARNVAARAFAPILVLDQPLRLPLAHVLVPTDFSDTARGALLVELSWASGLRAPAANARATTLTALHVQSHRQEASAPVETSSLDHELDLLARDAGSWAEVVVQGDVVHGDDAAPAIGQYAIERGTDLVVIGTRGQGANDESRLGSVSASVVVEAPVPTLLVPPAVWRTHATVH